MCNRILFLVLGVALFTVDFPAYGQQRLNCGFGQRQSFRDEAEFTSLGALIQKCDRIEIWRIASGGLDELASDYRLPLAPFKTVEVLKWGPPPGLIHPLESTPDAPAVPELDWNQPGRLVVAFIKGSRVAVCYGPCWREILIQGNTSRWNGLANDFAELYHGTVDQLIADIRKIQAGEEVIVSAVKAGDYHRGRLHTLNPSARIWRLKASLTITRQAQTIRAANFVGWGAADEAAIPQLTRELNHVDPCRRWHAIFDLMSMGKQASRAIPKLEMRLSDREPQLRLLAAQAIQRIEPENPLALPAIIFELRHRDAETRNLAAEILERHYRLPTVAALPIIAEFFEREPWPYSEDFASLMGGIGAHAPAETRLDLVALLARKLRASTDDDHYFRAAAIRAIGQLGPDIGPAVATLKCLVRRCPNTADDAAGVLVRCTPNGAAWLAEMLDKLRRIDTSGLIRFTDEPSEAIPILLKHLHNEKAWVRLRSAKALLLIGGRDFHESIRLSIGDLRESDDQAIARVARDLWPGDRDPAPPRVAEPRPDPRERLRQRRFALLEILVNGGGQCPRVMAIDNIGRQGPEARDIAPALWREMKKDDTETRAMLVRALWQIEGYAQSGMFQRDCRPALLAELRLMLRNHDKPDIQLTALDTVEWLGKQAASLAPDVIRCLKTPNLRLTAIDSLIQFGPAAKDAIPELLELAKVDERGLQSSAIIALCRVSRGSPEAMNLLNEWCESESVSLLDSFQQGDLNGPLAAPLVRKAIDNRFISLDRAIRLLQSCDPEAAMKLVWAEFNPLGWRVIP